jgi:4-hydroxybenzoate polyprenyltransferase
MCVTNSDQTPFAHAQATPTAWRKIFKLSRPRFWMYVFGPYIVGLVAGAGHYSQLQTPLVLLFGLFFLFPANILIYGINDIFDYETDKDNAKKTEYETLVPPDERATIWRIVLVFNLPFLLLPTQVNQQSVATIAAFLFFSIFYSAPPIRAKTKPILDSAFNVLYILPGIFGYFLAGGTQLNGALVIAAWCWAMAMHAYSAVPDITADRQNGLNTVATYLGFYGTLVVCTLLYVAAAMLSFRVLGRLSPLLAVLYVFLMHRSVASQSEEGVLRIYKVFPLVNTLCGAAIFWAVALSKWAPLSVLEILQMSR